MVEGKVCKLQEKTTVSQNKATHTSPAREMAYWEFLPKRVPDSQKCSLPKSGYVVTMT